MIVQIIVILIYVFNHKIKVNNQNKGMNDNPNKDYNNQLMLVFEKIRVILFLVVYYNLEK